MAAITTIIQGVPPPAALATPPVPVTCSARSPTRPIQSAVVRKPHRRVARPPVRLRDAAIPTGGRIPLLPNECAMLSAEHEKP